jgi:regulator of sigma E protease
MGLLITIVAFLVVLAVLILAHELGHLVTAKAFGVKVEEFGLGFPPRLWSKTLGETRYSLNAIPLGGFTKMTGEVDPAEPRSLASKSIGARILVLGSGSLMNALLPLLLFSIAFMVPHDAVIGEVVVKEVVPNSPAAVAGIQPEDTIISINDKPINNTAELSRYIQLNLGNEINMAIRHDDGTAEELQLIPRWRPPEGEGATGIMVTTLNASVVRQSEPFWRAIPMGVGECVETFVLFKNTIISLFIGTAAFQIGGPVAIAQITGEVAQYGISPLLEFAAFLSINLALINMFPIPALDGGRIVFVLIEWIRRGKRISPRTEGLIHGIGFALLMAAILAVTYQDIVRIISGGSLVP